jgi:hypothetical protein
MPGWFECVSGRAGGEAVLGCQPFQFEVDAVTLLLEKFLIAQHLRYFPEIASHMSPVSLSNRIRFRAARPHRRDGLSSHESSKTRWGFKIR